MSQPHPRPSDADPRTDPGADELYRAQRDARNPYPLVAYTYLTDPQLRAAISEVARDVCTARMFGYSNSGQGLATAKMVMLKGMAMGMDFVRSLETIRVINGTPTIRGPQALHLIRDRAPESVLDCQRSNEEECVWVLGRPGQAPKEFSRTRAQADKAGLPTRNELWGLYPSRMLKWSAFSEGAQELFGDVLMGCYIAEEMSLEYQFDRALNEAIDQSEVEPRRAAKTPPRQPKAGDEGPTAASTEQRGALRKLLSQCVRATGVEPPVAGEDPGGEARQRWEQARKDFWEAASKKVLGGKVAKRDSLTRTEAALLQNALAEMLRAATDAREQEPDREAEPEREPEREPEHEPEREPEPEEQPPDTDQGEPEHSDGAGGGS